jgi:hypothetical protein
MLKKMIRLPQAYKLVNKKLNPLRKLLTQITNHYNKVIMNLPLGKKGNAQSFRGKIVFFKLYGLVW